MEHGPVSGPGSVSVSGLAAGAGAEEAKTARIPWPAEVQLYQPPEQSQLLLPERASCLAVKTYLRMCRLPFVERSSANAEYMSPGGRLTKLPLLRAGQTVLAEFEPIARFVRGVERPKLDSESDDVFWLDETSQDDMRSLVTHTQNIFTLAELHLSYLDATVYAQYTAPRIASAHPWPLSLLQRYNKRREALRLLKVYQWHGMEVAAVRQQLANSCQLLTNLLDQSSASGGFLYGARPCELDAMVFGHVAALLCTQLPNMTLAVELRRHTSLIAYCQRIDDKFYAGEVLAELKELKAEMIREPEQKPMIEQMKDQDNDSKQEQLIDLKPEKVTKVEQHQVIDVTEKVNDLKHDQLIDQKQDSVIDRKPDAVIDENIDLKQDQLIEQQLDQVMNQNQAQLIELQQEKLIKPEQEQLIEKKKMEQVNEAVDVEIDQQADQEQRELLEELAELEQMADRELAEGEEKESQLEQLIEVVQLAEVDQLALEQP